MTPPVLNTEDPDQTGSDKESKNAQVSAPLEPAQVSAQVSEVIQPPIELVSELTSIDTSAEKPSTDTTADVVDATTVDKPYFLFKYSSVMLCVPKQLPGSLSASEKMNIPWQEFFLL